MCVCVWCGGAGKRGWVMCVGKGKVVRRCVRACAKVAATVRGPNVSL